MNDFNTDLVIVGAGAAGLIAAVTAGELGLDAILVERRHRVGLKLLMCGNNRCNISHALEPQDMLQAYGHPVQDFLDTALNAFPPQVLCQWFARNGLATVVKNERIYPTTENGDDVLHCFTDRLREMAVPLLLNCPVNDLSPLPQGGYQVQCQRLRINAKNVLLATGGVSYPKTGSVGDGHRILRNLGIKVTELRPGLAGVDVDNPELTPGEKTEITQTAVTVADPEGFAQTTTGNILCDHGCLRGTAIFDATRLIARHQLKNPTLTLDLMPNLSCKALQARLKDGTSLTALGIPEPLAHAMAPILKTADPARLLKQFAVNIQAIRPLKEAIVTVGGVAQEEINPQTMELIKLPGLFLAGELMDVDGPTGGFNLHAAFATARLAVRNIALKLGYQLPQETKRKPRGETGRNQGRTDHPDRTPYARRSQERPARRSSDYPGEHQDGQRRTTHAYADSKPGNRWNNSEFDRKRTYSRPGDEPRGQRRTTHSYADAKPGNRWDNSEFEQKHAYNRPGDEPRGQRRTTHTHADAKPGNRWDNSEFEHKRPYPPRNSHRP